MKTHRRHKNKFSSAARHRLLDLDLTVTELARQIGRPRATVSKSIHSDRFPHVRAAVVEKLGLQEVA